MKLFTYILVALCFWTSTIQAQQTDKFDYTPMQKNNMLILTSWGAVNMAAGVAGALTTTGSQQSFWTMNGLWGVVNLGIGLPSALMDIQGPVTPAAKSKSYRVTSAVLALNTGLDVAYMATGAWFWERANYQTDPNVAVRNKGWGQAFVLQGAALLIFDIYQWAKISKHAKQFEKEKLSLLPASNGIGLKLTF